MKFTTNHPIVSVTTVYVARYKGLSTIATCCPGASKSRVLDRKTGLGVAFTAGEVEFGDELDLDRLAEPNTITPDVVRQVVAAIGRRQIAKGHPKTIHPGDDGGSSAFCTEIAELASNPLPTGPFVLRGRSSMAVGVQDADGYHLTWFGSMSGSGAFKGHVTTGEHADCKATFE